MNSLKPCFSEDSNLPGKETAALFIYLFLQWQYNNVTMYIHGYKSGGKCSAPLSTQLERK